MVERGADLNELDVLDGGRHSLPDNPVPAKRGGGQIATRRACGRLGRRVGAEPDRRLVLAKQFNVPAAALVPLGHAREPFFQHRRVARRGAAYGERDFVDVVDQHLIKFVHQRPTHALSQANQRHQRGDDDDRRIPGGQAEAEGAPDGAAG
ncbi:MAG: hypothetical protein H0T51_16970 [Pirellulales bacterium]|nr:hypothetical protein [Pirellulales bacterium]